MYKYSLFVIAIFCFSSCEEQMVNIPTPESVETSRVVLLEELTGVSCSACPGGAAVVESILKEFPGQVVAYGIHGDFQCEPVADSKYDFRNQDGFDLENYLTWLGKPAAVINRVKYEGEPFWANDVTGQWRELVVQQLQEGDPVVNVFITPTYETDTRRIDIDVRVGVLEQLEGEQRLTLVITENHIIDPQKDTGEIIPDYEHNHVLREILTNVTGDVIGTDLSEGNVDRSFSFTLPEEDGTWIPQNIEIIGFVTNHTADGEPVLQAASSYLPD